MLASVNHEFVEEIKSMPSFVGIEVFHHTGKKIQKTVDCFSWAGVVKLYHLENQQLVKDYNRIREMEDSGLFIVK